MHRGPLNRDKFVFDLPLSSQKILICQSQERAALEQAELELLAR